MSNLLKSKVMQTVDTGFTSIPVQLIQQNVPIDSAELATETSPDVARVEEHYAKVMLESKTLLAEAQRDCDLMRERVEETLKEIKENARVEGHEAGYEVGYEMGLREGQRQFEAKIDFLRNELIHINLERMRLFNSIPDVLTKITITAIQNMLQREITTAPADIVASVESLLQYVVESTRVEICVHPEDLSSAKEAVPRWRAMKFGEWDIVILPDATVLRGGCVIRSDVGRIDARIETKLALLEETLQIEMERSVKNDVLADA